MAELSERCTATSKRTHRRCGQLVIGGGVCKWHGGAAPAVAAAREARIAVAEARVIFSGDYQVREPAEVLMAAVADADAVLQRIKDRIEHSGEFLASDVDALGLWVDRAAKLSKVVLDAGVEERLVRSKERQQHEKADDFLAVLSSAVTALGHDIDDPAVRQVLFEALSGARPAPMSRPRALPAPSADGRSDAVDLT